MIALYDASRLLYANSSLFFFGGDPENPLAPEDSIVSGVRLLILKQLRALEIVASRRVCSRWKRLIDSEYSFPELLKVIEAAKPIFSLSEIFNDITTFRPSYYFNCYDNAPSEYLIFCKFNLENSEITIGKTSRALVEKIGNPIPNMLITIRKKEAHLNLVGLFLRRVEHLRMPHPERINVENKNCNFTAKQQQFINIIKLILVEKATRLWAASPHRILEISEKDAKKYPSMVVHRDLT